MSRCCRVNDIEGVVDMIIDKTISLGISGNAAVELLVVAMERTLRVDIGRVNCTYDGVSGIESKKEIGYSPFCGRRLGDDGYRKLSSIWIV